MAEDKQSTRRRVLNPWAETTRGMFGLAIIDLFVYYLIGLLHHIEFVKEFSRGISVLQWGTIIVLSALGSYGLISELVDEVKAAKARKANEQVAQAISDGSNIADVSTQEVAAKLKGANIADEQLARLVEQRKQQLLIDDNYFRDEVGLLIVTYLQPLPRNAKRLLNRFRVNLLIAHSRGMLTSEPKVSVQQLGKWLVLMERWPQLGRSVAAVPEKMESLEQWAPVAAPPSAIPPTLPLPDAFMDVVKALSPTYVGDEDLRGFIQSQPSLATVVKRLANYEAEAPRKAAAAAGK